MNRTSLNLFALRAYHIVETGPSGGLEVRLNVGRTILGGFAGTLAITLLMHKGPQ